MILKNHIIVSILAMENRMPNLSHTVLSNEFQAFVRIIINQDLKNV